MGTTSEREAPVRFQDVPPDLQAAVGEILRPKGLTVAGTNGAKWVPAMVVWAREGEEAGARDVTRRFQEGFDMAQAVESLREELESGTMMQKLGKIEGSIEAVARGTYELRQENEELRKFQQLGFFQFAVRVDGEDFRRFAIIMALGTRNAAAAFLRIPQRSFYDRVERWAEMGPDYQRMLRFVDWRKRSGRRIKVPLGGTVQSGEPSEGGENRDTLKAVAQQMADNAVDSRSYPDILREILKNLQRQNPGNWQNVRDELVELVKDEIPQKSPQIP